MTECDRRLSARKLNILCAVLAVALACAAPASAQIARILSDSRLSPEDVILATETAEELYTRPGVKVGDSLTWESAKSGAKGIVEVTKVDHGGACVSFRHTTLAGVSRRSQSASRRCRTADNTWVFSPD